MTAFTLLGGIAAGTAGPAAVAAIETTAVPGPGYVSRVDGHLTYLNGYLQDGVVLYCIELGKIGPWTGTHKVGDQARPGISADDNARLNAIVSTHGQTTDNNTGAAVAMLVWDLGDHDNYVAAGGDASIITRAPTDQRPAVLSKLAELRAEAASIVARPGNGTGTVTVTESPGNHTSGTVKVTDLNPADSYGTVSLKNAIFADTGTPSMTGVVDGQEFAIRTTPSDTAVSYEVTADATFRTREEIPYQGLVGVWKSGAGQQDTIGPGPTAPRDFTFTSTTTRSSIFEPTVGTEVASTFVTKGEAFEDVWKFDTKSGTNPWRQLTDGSYLPVKAHGTLYGPFQDVPKEGDHPPAGAPVAGTAAITTSTTDGPTGKYTAKTKELAKESGYYTWVVTIVGDDQTPATQNNIPAGYRFADHFGQAIETHIVPTDLRFATQLSDSTAQLGGTVTDTITPTVIGGHWITNAKGDRDPVRLRGTVYYSPDRPVVSDSAPEGTEVVGSMNAVLNDESEVVSDPIDLPTKAGFVSVQWCIDLRDRRAHHLVNPWCDQYGVPSETVELILPTVTTTAQPFARSGDTVSDTAHVTGPVPAGGLEITFEGFLQPKEITRTDQVSTATAVCTRENRVFTSTRPILAAQAGDYTSERFDTTGVLPDNRVVAWVETARIPGEDTPLTVGKCGAQPELTSSERPAPTKLAFTGSNLVGLYTGVGAATLAFGVILFLLRRRQQRTQRAATED